MINIEIIEFETVVRKIIASKAITNLEEKLDKWHKNNPAFLTKTNCNHLLSLVINENKYLQGKKVPKPYLNLRNNHLETLKNFLY